MVPESPATAAFRRGKFVEAWRLFEQRSGVSTEELVFSAELAYHLGATSRAVGQARRALERSSLSPEQESRYLSILAAHESDEGHLTDALALCAKSARLADVSANPRWRALAYAQLLERSCDRSGFDASLPLAAQTRRAAAQCDDPHAKVSVHVAFGRLEGRAGHFEVATRHFAVARELLQLEPNLYLGAVVDLDECGVLSLSGDIVRAIELGKRGAQQATDSGWSKGQVAAAVSLAHLFVTTGRLDAAGDQIKRASSSRGFRCTAYDIALADTKAQIALCQRKDETAERLLIEVETHFAGTNPWYLLMGQLTKVRLLLRQGRSGEAARLADAYMANAKEHGAEVLSNAFRMLSAEARISADCGLADVNAIAEENHEWPLSLVASKYLLLAKAFNNGGQWRRAHQQLRRAAEIVSAGISMPLELGVREAQLELTRVAPSAENDAAPRADLDGAAALMELAGHPHILGHEAFALVQGAGCAEGIALVAADGARVRVVKTEGWSDEQALAAASAADPHDVIPLGQHRHEAWQLVVAPSGTLAGRCTLAAIRKLVATAVALDRYRRDEKQRAALWPAEALDADPEGLWASAQSAELLGIARRIAATPLPVLLTGETGTGKEMLARVVHRASDRADKPMLPFNCSAVPRDMLESQLFGYRKGSFTGADVSFPGVIRAAAGGTLFLDEIAEIGLDLQPKLLRFLEHQEIHPLGEPHPIKVDVRIIAATNARVEQMVAQGRFREDLYYRLNVLHLKLPPLRERREEIPALVQHYIRRYSDEQKKGRLTLGDDALEYLLLYAWPGNIRQLANEVRRMVALAEPDSTLTAATLSPEIQASRRTVPAAAVVTPQISVPLDQPLPAAVELLEQTMVRRALERTHGRVEDASRLLGISRKGLFLKRRRWGIHQQRAS